MRLWRSRALTRDLVALTTVLSAARHYNVTMESRSFHIGNQRFPRAEGDENRCVFATMRPAWSGEIELPMVPSKPLNWLIRSVRD
jgi:hypothetical protein